MRKHVGMKFVSLGASLVMAVSPVLAQSAKRDIMGIEPGQTLKQVQQSQLEVNGCKTLHPPGRSLVMCQIGAPVSRTEGSGKAIAITFADLQQVVISVELDFTSVDTPDTVLSKLDATYNILSKPTAERGQAYAEMQINAAGARASMIKQLDDHTLISFGSQSQSTSLTAYFVRVFDASILSKEEALIHQNEVQQHQTPKF